MSNTDVSELDKDILLTIYNNLRANQDLYVNQMWKTIYLAFLVYAGLYFVRTKIDHQFFICIAIGLLCLTWAMCTTFMFLHDGSLKGEGKAYEKIREHSQFGKALLTLYPDPSSWKSRFIFWSLQITNSVGAIVIGFLIYSYTPPVCP